MIILPNEATDILHNYLRKIETGTGYGIPIGVKKIDEQLIPIENGQLMTVLARPNNGKSSVVNHYMRQASKQYMEHKTDYAPPVLVTLESPIEEIQLRNLANFAAIDSKAIRTRNNMDWKTLHDSVDKMAVEFPMIYIGHSAYLTNKKKHRITFETISDDIQAIQDKAGRRVRAVGLDYIQLMSMKGYDDRRIMLSECVIRLKEMAMENDFPIIMAAQANRTSDTEQKFPVPQPYHAKDTGSIEEASDIILSCMRPCKYYKIGEAVPYSEEGHLVTPFLYFLYLAKQRDGESSLGFWLSMDSRIGSLSDLEIDLGD